MTFNFSCRQAVLLGILLLQANCQKQEEYAGDTLSGGKVMILGHAGMGIGFSTPGNTYESISTAISIGCDGSELDVQMTRDSILVAFHDKDLSAKTSCDGRICEKDWMEIRDCKYDMTSKPILLCPLEELFDRLPDLRNLYFSFDVKLDQNVADKDLYEYRFLRAIRRLCDRYKMGTHVFIEGSPGFLDKAKQFGLENRLFLFSNNDDDPAEKARQKYHGISTTMDISAEDIQRAYRNGLLVMVWDPDNYYQNKATLDRKPDIIQTDDPITILKLLKRFNYENTTP